MVSIATRIREFCKIPFGVNIEMNAFVQEWAMAYAVDADFIRFEARSGGKIRVGFEGGQMPLARRIPKRGFNNIFAKPLTAVNLGQLNVFEDGAVVDAAALTEKGIIRDCKYGLKVLSNGNLTKKLTVKAAAFSGSAKTKIEEAGGKAEVV